MQLSVEVRNGRANAIEGVIGPSPTLQICGGTTMPANTAAPLVDNPILVATPLPVDWLAVAANGLVGNSVIWSANADQAGQATFFRIVDANGLCHMQGTVSALGGTGDMQIDSAQINAGQLVKVTSFQLTEPNA